MMFNRLWFDIAIFFFWTIVIYVEIPMLPLLGIQESRRFIFLNMRESGAVGKGGAAYSVHGRLSQLADVRVGGRPVLPFRYVTCDCLWHFSNFELLFQLV